MSSIIGIFFKDGRSVDPKMIKIMNDRIAHRGPNGSNTYCKGSIALGHQMLWTTPESLYENLPFHEKKIGLIITADARIDNRKELSKILDIKNEESISDSYFILKSYQKWGEQCPKYLLGDFTFAIWDENEDKLFCARDHMGVKPFYYYLDENMFVFGTEIKALFGVPKVPKEINELQIGLHLALITGEERELTFYKNIYRLPAASSLTVKLEHSNLKKYWELDLSNEINLSSDEEYEKAFLEIFTESVKCRLRSGFRVGSMLSGGLDSSSVACTAQKILKKNNNTLKTFSAVFDSVPDSDETYFIEKAVSYSKFDPYFVNADKITPLSEIDSFLWYSDSPLIFPNSFMLWNIYRDANKNDTRILLDGLGGDETVSHGYGFFNDLVHTMRWRKLIQEINALKKAKSLPYKSIFLSICFNILPKFFKIKLISFLGNKQNKLFISELTKKDFDGTNLMNKINEIQGKRLGIGSSREQHFNELNSGLTQLEMEQIDWMSANFSIEARHPFYDKRLIEFCLAIPTEQKISNGWDRSIMRRAMSEILPKEIQWRTTKGDLSFNFDRAFIREKQQLDSLSSINNYFIEKYVDIKIIKEIYLQCKSGNFESIMYLWNALLLNLWLKKEFK
jgi:asparagine synthase (glutamine-hydrolysing)